MRAPSSAVQDCVTSAQRLRHVPHGVDPRMSTGASQMVQPLSHLVFKIGELVRKVGGIPVVVKVEFLRILGNRKKAHYFHSQRIWQRRCLHISYRTGERNAA